MGNPEVQVATAAAGDQAIAGGALVIATRRLDIRRLTLEDAPFIFRLLNDPAWLRFIGDKGVRTLDDARRYIADGPMAMYERAGFGLYLVVRKKSGASMGLCGLIRREGLDHVDIGFALLPEFHGRGYGHEAAAAVMELGRKVFRIERIVAITSPDNSDSIRLIERLGLRFERRVRLVDGGDEIFLYA